MALNMHRHVSIKLDNNETVSSIEAFRRVLTAARWTLAKLQQTEGNYFPPVDKAALALINSLQFDHKELI
jgi:hypothetical protein